MYLICSTLIQKQVSKNILFFAVGITFFNANVSDFYTYFTAKNQNLEASYLYEKLSYTKTFW